MVLYYLPHTPSFYLLLFLSVSIFCFKTSCNFTLMQNIRIRCHDNVFCFLPAFMLQWEWKDKQHQYLYRGIHPGRNNSGDTRLCLCTSGTDFIVCIHFETYVCYWIFLTRSLSFDSPLWSQWNFDPLRTPYGSWLYPKCCAIGMGFQTTSLLVY